jgi:hypothetical protein
MSSVVYQIYSSIWRVKNFCKKGDLEKLKSTQKEKDKAVEPLIFSAYEHIMEDPVAFYQLTDSNDLDEIHLRLKSSYQLYLDELDHVSFSSVAEATPAYEKVLGRFERTINNIDKRILQHREIVAVIDEGAFLQRWNERRKNIAKDLGLTLKYAEI